MSAGSVEQQLLLLGMSENTWGTEICSFKISYNQEVPPIFTSTALANS